jgi:hypothetical protein
MGSGNRRRQQEQEDALRQQQAAAAAAAAAATTRANEAIAPAAIEDPLTQRFRDADTRWLDLTEGKSGPIDFSKSPELGVALGNYEAAKNAQGQERMGLGALQMGSQGSNPGLAQLLKQQSQDHLQQDAAGQLQDAVKMKDAEVRGSLLPLADFSQNRRMGIASLQTGRESAAFGNQQNATNAYSQFLTRPQPQSFWKSLLLSGIGGASQIAGGMASGGTGFFRP